MARARKALAQAGFNEHAPLTRASSVTNEVWLSDEYVIRVNRRPNHRLRREAFLGPLLPASVGYPTTIAYGGELGADWLIAERRPGEMLSVCWPDMNEFERRNAVRQLAGMLRELHNMAVPPELSQLDQPPQLLDPTQMPVVTAAVRRARRTRTGSRDLRRFDGRCWLTPATSCSTPPPRSSRTPTTTLIHGDLHFQNVLWDGFSVTAVARPRVGARRAARSRPRRVPAILRAPALVRRTRVRRPHAGRGLRRRSVLVGRVLPRALRARVRARSHRARTRSPTTCAISSTRCE